MHLLIFYQLCCTFVGFIALMPATFFTQNIIFGKSTPGFFKVNWGKFIRVIAPRQSTRFSAGSSWWYVLGTPLYHCTWHAYTPPKLLRYNVTYSEVIGYDPDFRASWMQDQPPSWLFKTYMVPFSAMGTYAHASGHTFTRNFVKETRVLSRR